MSARQDTCSPVRTITLEGIPFVESDCQQCGGFGLVESTLPMLGPGRVWEDCDCTDVFGGERYGDDVLVLPDWQRETLHDIVPITVRAPEPISAVAPTLRAP
jgi:hypothetical protein